MKLFAKKSLGQHFLNSAHVLEQITSAAKIKRGEIIFEIGPGTGVLTSALLDAGANLIAIEKDARSIELLKNKFKNEISVGRLILIEDDILEITSEKINGSINKFKSNTETDSTNKENMVMRNGHSRFSLIANIPYYITGAILEKFLEHGPRPERMILLVQKEVADRIVTKDNKESILSLSVKAFGNPNIVAKVPPGAFIPPPKVDSAILSISNISDSRFKDKSIDPSEFFKIIKSAFAHKRKFAIRNIENNQLIDKSNQAKLANAWNTLGIDTRTRAEDINIDQWFDIANLLKNNQTI